MYGSITWLRHACQAVRPGFDSSTPDWYILPFPLAKSNERLTDRGGIALVEEDAEAIGLPEKVDGEFPAPGSNRGIGPSAYVRTLECHFSG